MKPKACLGRDALARSRGAWLMPRSTRVYPPTCLACRAATDSHGALCPRCWSALRFIERPYCERLGTPFEQDLGHGLISPQAMADPPVYARARAVARFEDGPARTLVHRLKYSDRAELARPIARWMARAGADVLAEADLLTPVPLHALRLWRRRFNQAAALTAEISRQTAQTVRSGRPSARQGDASARWV